MLLPTNGNGSESNRRRTANLMRCSAHGRPLRHRWPKHGCELVCHDVANGVGPPSPEPWEDAVAAPSLPKPQACRCGGSVAPTGFRVMVSVIGCECGRGSGLSGGLERKRPPLPRLARRAECGPRRLVRWAARVAPTPFMPGHVALSVVCCDRRGTVGCVLCAGWFDWARLVKRCRMSHVPTTLVCSCSIAKSNQTTVQGSALSLLSVSVCVIVIYKRYYSNPRGCEYFQRRRCLVSSCCSIHCSTRIPRKTLQQPTAPPIRDRYNSQRAHPIREITRRKVPLAAQMLEQKRR
jgi:hypothetical protein